MFVARVLAGRRVLPLACPDGGDHPSAAVNVAALVQTVAATPGRRVLNIADPDAPTVREIAATVAAHLDHEWRIVPVSDGAPDPVGRTPWDRDPPVVLDTSAADALGYTPVGDYADTVTAELDWLVGAHVGAQHAVQRDRDGDTQGETARATAAGGRWPLPADDDPFFGALLDYAAEDRALASDR